MGRIVQIWQLSNGDIRVALGSILASQGLPSGDFAIITALHCLSVTFMFSWNALNDYMDIEIDRINRPDRPLPSRRFLKLQLVGILSTAVLRPLSVEPTSLIVEK